MSYRLLIAALAAAGAVFATQFYVPADAATNLNTSRSNIYREGTPKGATGTTGKSSKSNTGDRMGGGGGGKGAAGVTTVKSSKSNSSDRMGGGGGGKGATR
jgi:hypothetical protein